MGDEARNAFSGIHDKIRGPSRGEITFLPQPLEHILPTSKTCYLVEWNGRSCIVDEKQRPKNGDTVLLDMSGMYEWGIVYQHPCRIITDDGLTLEDDLLEDVSVVGVVTHEVTALHEQDGAPI